MAKLTTRQADMFMYNMAKPIIDKLSKKLGYEVYVYYPGIDAPRVKNKQQTFIEFLRTTLRPEPLSVSASGGQWTPAQLRVIIHATEKKDEFNPCADTADEFTRVFNRRRCGYDIIVRTSYWEDTEARDGRKLFSILIDYEYESY